MLTAKHVSGFCLWPATHTEYHVGNSGNPTDVVSEFVEACNRHDVMPGLYYCSWDNRHLFGSRTPSMIRYPEAFTTREYQEFQMAQLTELAKQYPSVGEWWIDIPSVLPRYYRQELYEMLAEATPEAVIVMNHGISNAAKFKAGNAWPSDVITIERFLPPSKGGHKKWREIEGDQVYMPGEVCDPLGQHWFYEADDVPRSDEELLGMYWVSRARGANLLLNVGPDQSGRIPEEFAEALRRLGANIRKGR